MKNRREMLVMFVAVLLLSVSTVWADSLSVVPEAAMGGTNFGLRIDHDNSSVALVQDDTPNREEIYRVEFLFNVNDVTYPPGGAQNFRQLIFLGTGLNPTPTSVNPASICGNLKFASVFRVFHQTSGGLGQNDGLVAWNTGNLCGACGIGQLIDRNTDYRVCMEWNRSDAPLGGRLAMVAVPAAESCPPTGDPSYVACNVTNSRLYLEFVELGTPRTNLLGVGETTTLFFDEFASFRTLAP